MLKNKDFIYNLVLLTIPVALQTMLFSSRNLSDVWMTSSFGVEDVGAVGIAGKYAMLATVVLFGVSLSAGQYLSQLKGKDETAEFNKYFYSLLSLTIPIGVFISFVFLLFSGGLISLFSSDKKIIQIGSEYLSIIAPQMILAAIGISFNIGLRSLHKPAISTWFSVIGVILNIILNYILIYGKFGIEPLGAKGAAYATTISCAAEIVLLGLYLNLKNIQIRYSKKHLIKNVSSFKAKKILSTALPITLSNLGIAAGGFAYAFLISLSGKDALAALSVILPIEAFILSFLIGLSSAATVLIGGALGESKKEKAYKMGTCSIGFTIISTLPFILIMFLLESTVFNLFSDLGSESLIIAKEFYLIIMASAFFKSISSMLTNGILRSGGDNKYCLKLDLLSQWAFSIPVMCILHFYFQVDVVILFLATLLEDIVKILFASFRVSSKKWMNTIV